MCFPLLNRKKNTKRFYQDYWISIIHAFTKSHIIIINIPFNRLMEKQILNTENGIIFLCIKDSYGQNGLLPICQLA